MKLKSHNKFIILLFLLVVIMLLLNLNVYLNTKKLVKEHFTENVRILYVIRSISKFYDDRLKSQHDTWMKLLNSNEEILVASDDFKHKDKFGLKYSTPSNCPRNHGDGPCCSESNALVMALNEHNFDWIFILDDDVYLYPPKVREIIYKYKDNHKVAIGTPGCVANKIGGFCGGGGYGFSRKTLEKLVGNDTDKFLKEYKEHCDGTQFCDITTADLLVKKGIELVNIKELRPWGIKKKDKEQINNNEVATLHYYGGELTKDYKEIPDKMNFLHKIFTNIKETFTSRINKY